LARARRLDRGDQLGDEVAARADGRAFGLVAGPEPEAVALERLEQAAVAVFEIVDQSGPARRAVLAARTEGGRVTCSGWERFLIEVCDRRALPAEHRGRLRVLLHAGG
jgi:hypothetical protein